jgi:hypothetical protein
MSGRAICTATEPPITGVTLRPVSSIAAGARRFADEHYGRRYRNARMGKR